VSFEVLVAGQFLLVKNVWSEKSTKLTTDQTQDPISDHVPSYKCFKYTITSC